tara:strand:+ start:594 stop:1031 length:438 start_codon:yes stop_codon:yes gene_type:complete
MKIIDLKPIPGSVKSTKRRGRGHGSGLGRSSGRGDKGAGQRSGNKKRPWFEGGQLSLARRVPKRGFTNIFRKETQIVNISSLENINSSEIDASVLFENGLVRSALKPIKILGNGELKQKVTIKASAFSKSALEKIKISGGVSEIQ